MLRSSSFCSSLLRTAIALATVLELSSSTANSQCLNWETFAGTTTIPDIQLHAGVQFDDGTGPVVYAATGTTEYNMTAVRWDGQSVTPLPGLLGTIRSMDVFAIGGASSVYAMGSFNLQGVATAVARWTGSTWQPIATVATTSYEGVQAILEHDDGTGPALYIAGNFSAVEGVPVANIARWDGTVWSPVGSGTDGPILGLAVHDEGSGPRLFLAGWFQVAGGLAIQGIARWDGAVFSDVGGGLGVPFGRASLCSFDDGLGPALILCGQFPSPVFTFWASVRAWRNGSWATLGQVSPPDASYPIRVLTADDGTGLGLYETTSTGTAAEVRRWNGAQWVRVAQAFHAACGGTPQATTPALLDSFDFGSGPRLFASGGFAAVQNGPVAQLVRLEGSEWVRVQGAQSQFPAVTALTSFDDGNGPALYVGGPFCDFAGVEAVQCARRRGGVWEGTGFILGNMNNPSVGAFGAFDLGSGQALYATGRFAVGSANNLGIARWTGSDWEALGFGLASAGLMGRCLAAADLGTGPRLYVGGTFTFAGGVPSPNLAAWDGTAWHAVPPGPTAGVTGEVRGLATFDDGTGPALFVAGSFLSQTDGSPLTRIARWNGSALNAIGSGMNGDVWALRTFDDGQGARLYAAGAFTLANGVAANRIARFDGTSWSPLGMGFDALVTALEVFDDGSGPALYAAGNFTASGTTPLPRIARWNGSTWSALANGVAPSVSALAAHTDSSGERRLFVGGTLSTAGVIATSNLAAWRACDDLLERFCVADGTTTVCPCDNAGLAARGCNNSANTGGARLNAMGSASLDTISLHAAGETPNAATLVFQGDVLRTNPTLFGDGLLCLGGNLKRLYTLNASAGQITVPGVGQLSLSQRSAQLGDVLKPGSVRGYQAWYRDANAAFCSAPLGANWNLTNGVRVVW